MKIALWIVGFIALVGLLRIGELYTQIFRYQTYWNKYNQQTLSNTRAQSIRYYALGDSSAQGIGASSPKKSYPALVAKELKIKNDKAIELVNLSKSGAKIDDAIREQIPIMQSLGIDKDTVVTIEIGANDITNFNPDEFERAMDELMSKLPKQTIISDIPSFAGSRLSKYERNVLEANEIIVRLSDKHGLKRALLYDRVSANHGITTFSADLFHPSDRGYRTNWAPAFVEQL